ncbi:MULTISPECIES: ParA family protein [Bacteria]|uniref:ParA family protein n=1 Tax=Bacteria TaxID=2 RepID=UPI002E7B901E|nr:ParA family protein [Cetobacterium somerae]WVJ03006.1 ParA family protein [Cetobacterium somerae]
MLKIVIANNKGGVAKTTSVFNIISYFASNGFKVLAIDMDSQGNLTECYDVGDVEYTAFDAMKERDVRKYIIENVADNLDLLPADCMLEAANLDFSSVIGREHLLAKALRHVENDYDICVIDTAPSLSLLTLNSLAAANRVYIPLGSGFFELKGASILMDAIKQIKDGLNEELEIGGMFITRHDSRTKISNDVINKVKDVYGSNIMDTIIRNNIALVESAAAGQSIFEYKNSSIGAEDYKNLCLEIIKKEGIKTNG